MSQKSLLPNYPVIGLVAKVSEEHDAWHYHLIVDELRRVILDSGGIPRGILSPQLHSDFQYVDEADYSTLSPLSYNILRTELSAVDGVILQGGMTSNCYERQAAEICLDSDIPILGICSGFNNLVRALGGDVRSIDPDEAYLARHKQIILKAPDYQHFKLRPAAHPVSISTDSLLFEILGKNEVMVNSSHTYVAFSSDIRKSRIAAVCPEDKTVEAFEVANQTFAMGIKWHPEMMPEMKPLFDHFIDACRERKVNAH